MAATDAYGNPSPVVTDELIESAWGNAVESRVVPYYPTVAAYTAAAPHPTGFVRIGGAAYITLPPAGLRGIAPFYPAVGAVARGNVIGLTEIGSAVLPTDVVDRVYDVAWHIALTGHTAAGTVEPRFRNDAAQDLALGSVDGFNANQPMTTIARTRLVQPANAAAFTVHLWLTVAGAAANTNVGGGVFLIGYAT